MGPCRVFVARDDGKGCRHFAMGHGDAGVFRHRDGACNARHEFKGKPLFLQEQRFFAAAAEHKGIAAFETGDDFAFPGQIGQKTANVFLFHRMVARSLADVNPYRVVPGPAQNAGIGQPVVDDDICPGQAVPALQRQQARIAGARANQIHFSFCCHGSDSFVWNVVTGFLSRCRGRRGPASSSPVPVRRGRRPQRGSPGCPGESAARRGTR